MRLLRICAVAVSIVIAGGLGYQFNHADRASTLTDDGAGSSPPAAKIHEAAGQTNLSSDGASTQRYGLDASKSKFIAHALAGGLLWFKGHDHLVAVREFTGEAHLTPDSITPASLQITAKAGSMVETSSVFTEPQKQIIDKELREIVLEPAKYPDIVFKSTNVSGKANGNNQYDLKIAGDLTLHGVTRQITIPTQVTVAGNELRAHGEFSINRGDFKVKATSAEHGLIRVRDKVEFTFDIVGHRL
jgi:polyisoprenoid-binding protein YceI